MIKKTLVLLLIVLLAQAAVAEFVKQECQCDCAGTTITAVGMYPKSGPESPIGLVQGLLNIDDLNARLKCNEQCARICGGTSKCDGECGSCCDDFCGQLKVEGQADPGLLLGLVGVVSTDPEGACKKSCKSNCEFREVINSVTNVIYMVAGIVGALMIVFHGIKIITSQDPAARDEAKSAIWYVILALIIIVVAGQLVGLLTSVALNPGDGGEGTGGTDGTGDGDTTPTPQPQATSYCIRGASTTISTGSCSARVQRQYDDQTSSFTGFLEVERIQADTSSCILTSEPSRFIGPGNSIDCQVSSPGRKCTVTYEGLVCDAASGSGETVIITDLGILE